MPADRGRTIVLIEDDADIRKLVVDILSAEGYRVVASGDPQRAVELVRESDPDLVVSDIAMPGMDGYAVLRALQSDPTTARYPVIFLSAQRDFSERVRAFRYGVVDYVSKPFTRETLVKKIERILDGRGRRPGPAVPEAEAPAGELLEEVQRDSRSGVLTVSGPEGEARVVIRAGEVVESSGGRLPQDPAARARFRELDANTEDIVAHDPDQLPRSERLPPAEQVPDVLRHVVVVDDNSQFRAFLAGLLRSRGFVVHEASNGEDGLKLALERRPWLILSDVRMPEADGFEFCRRVRSHSLLRQTPFLFLSGWDDYKQRYHGLEMGADDFISKETPIRELLIRIQLLMKRYSDLQVGGSHGAGMVGDLAVIGVPGVLQLCHLNRLSGVLTADVGARRAVLGFRNGEIVAARCGEIEGLAVEDEEAVYDFLGWDQGRFEFAPQDGGQGPPLGESFDRLLLEGCRRLDEAQRGGATTG
jgi:DNA-binding response OmpR family regulator